jgi:hypothetical protein
MALEKREKHEKHEKHVWIVIGRYDYERSTVLAVYSTKPEDLGYGWLESESRFATKAEVDRWIDCRDSTSSQEELNLVVVSSYDYIDIEEFILREDHHGDGPDLNLSAVADAVLMEVVDGNED